jgi:hypothetical protein
MIDAVLYARASKRLVEHLFFANALLSRLGRVVTWALRNAMQPVVRRAIHESIRYGDRARVVVREGRCLAW